MIRRIMLVTHGYRQEALDASVIARRELENRGIDVVTEDTTDGPVDLLLAIGGDGTILAAAAQARRFDVPLLGVNIGRMGFLAEVSGTGIPTIVSRLANGQYTVDSRMTLDVTLRLPHGESVSDWALNEAVLAHTDPAHPVHLGLVVDGQSVSTYGADGMIISTPTGSTAYSFSAGGPVVWPDTEAIVLTPLAAHGLFTRPLVVGPSSIVEVLVLEDPWSAPEIYCDGLRTRKAPCGSILQARVGEKPIRLVRLDQTPFSARLVSKFHLPVNGWRLPIHDDEVNEETGTESAGPRAESNKEGTAIINLGCEEPNP